jgi:hypothetical protein
MTKLDDTIEDLTRTYHGIYNEAQRLQRLWECGQLKTTADIRKYQRTKDLRNHLLAELIPDRRRTA